MKQGGGKSKGSEFERKICKQLSLWVSDGQHEDCMWRSAMSGGRATVAFRTGKVLRRQAGDITATSPEGELLTSKCYLECKHVANLSIEGFLLTNKGLLAKFWVTAQKEAKQYDHLPLIIARQNRTADLVLMPHRAFVHREAKPLFERAHHWEIWLLTDLLAQPFSTFKISELC